jgi:hypothetical protein
MFRCEVCSCVVPLRTRSRRLVIASRKRDYPYRPKANIHRYLDLSSGRPKKKEKLTDDPGGIGREIVREVKVCPACADTHKAT